MLRHLLAGTFLLICAIGLAPRQAEAQPLVLPCVASGVNCVPVSAANPLPTTGGNATITAGSTATSGFVNGDLISSSGGFTADSGVLASSLNRTAGQVLVGNGATGPTSDAGLTKVAGATGMVTSGGLLGTSSAGAAGNPSLFIGNSTTGLYSVSTSGFGMSVNGVSKADYGISIAGAWLFNTSVNLASGMNLSINNGELILGNGLTHLFTGAAGELRFAQTGATNLTFLTTVGTATLQHGANDVNGAPVAQTIKFQNALAGSATNQTSPNTTIIGSLGTGTGTNGDYIVQLGVKTTTGTAQATPTTAITIKGETLQVNLAGQLNIAAMTQTATAQSGTVCYNSGTGAVTYDATVGCLTSTMTAKDSWRAFTPSEALAIVTQFEAGAYTYKAGLGLPEGPQIGLLAQQVAAIDNRLVGYAPDGMLRGVRYQQTSALYGPAIRAVSDDVAALRAAALQAIQEVDAKVEAMRDEVKASHENTKVER